MFTRSTSIPLPKISVATIIRFLKLLNYSNRDILSDYWMPEWIHIEGKLDFIRSLFKASALAVDFTKMITWLNCKASRRSISFRFFWFSSSFEKYCYNPWRVSPVSLSMRISKGYFMNFLHVVLIDALSVAENICTCFWWGVILKIDWTSLLMSRASNILSHSSSMKCLIFWVSKCLPRTRARMRPGVPTTTVGGSFFNFLMC